MFSKIFYCLWSKLPLTVRAVGTKVPLIAVASRGRLCVPVTVGRANTVSPGTRLCIVRTVEARQVRNRHACPVSRAISGTSRCFIRFGCRLDRTVSETHLVYGLHQCMRANSCVWSVFSTRLRLALTSLTGCSSEGRKAGADAGLPVADPCIGAFDLAMRRVPGVSLVCPCNPCGTCT